ncbi:hsdR [Pectobacterium versatile]|uniref:HsdR n=2 Tax=Pectobacterium TaxID=122277 RepID=A0AAW3SYH4_9GAMM|nr:MULTISPECIES: hsdR [Pectobacterium]MBA5204755.1 hsdR [Pectobacterium aroidearum]MBN3170976.1 hsdR [Pectobacterium brasiliense]MBN3176385.1 hsdR [Pectobacterium parmentieri]MBQ4790885.1 hsdR [Pectobacterium versatile]QHQ23421.1 hsdR [Pectobacterium parvum]
MNIQRLRAGSLELSPEVRGLLDNGMDFLQKAQDEFSTSPTHSIVSFWTAVELLLKVPLAHEHWSLVCSGRKIIRAKYRSGDFQSITFAEACERLNDVLEKPLPSATLKAFDKIRQHRNRVVHFYHSAFTDEEKTQLLVEQADAWFALNRLMREDWKSIFEGALGHYLTGQETRLLIKNTYYADIKFTQVKPEIKKHQKKGGKVTDCYRCSKSAALEKEVFEINGYSIKTSSCLVCNSLQDGLVEFSCPECNKPQTLKPWDETDFECTKCQYSVSRYDLLDTSSYSQDEYDCAPTPAGCSECDTEHSVCELGKGYFCTYCFSLFESIGQCECCGYHSTDVNEFSVMTGCSFCEGHPETWPDDDD